MVEKYKIKIGLICLGRHTYDVKAADEIYQATCRELMMMEAVEWITVPEIVITQEEAIAAAERILAARVDGIAIISGTFHLGHLALLIDRIVKKPVLLWAFPELPYNGGKIRLNSVCGLNLNASNLYKAGSDTYCCIVSDQIDEDWVDALRMKAALEYGHIGIAGYRADGFFNLDIDELPNYTRTGVLLQHFELEEMFQGEIEEAFVEQQKHEITGCFSCKELSTDQIDKVAKLCKTTEDFLNKHKLDALAVRCWPEYASRYGVSPCAMMSILQAKGRILACEGDVEGAMTMLALKAAGAETPFLADLSQVNFDEDYALLWHCGVAPANLRDGICEASLDTYFAGGKGVTAGFVLKSGPINIVRFDTARGKTRVFISKGNALPMEKQLTGTYARVKFDCTVQELLCKVMNHGVAHHVVMIYGDYINKIRIFAKIMGWEVLEC